MNELDLQQRQSLMDNDSVDSEATPTPPTRTEAADDVTADDVTDDVLTQEELHAEPNPEVVSAAKPPLKSRSLRTKQSILRKQKKFDETSSTEPLTDTNSKDGDSNSIVNAENLVNNGGPDQYQDSSAETVPIIKRKLSKPRGSSVTESKTNESSRKGSLTGSQNGRQRHNILPRKYLISQASLAQRTASQDSDTDPDRRRRHRQPCEIPCCGRTFKWPQLLTWCKCCEQKPEPEDDFDIPFEDEPLRKRCSRVCITFIYVVLATVAVVFTYSMIQDLITSMKNPVRSIHFNKVTDYDAPGIAVYQGGAKFLACGHYYNNVVTSKTRLTQLDLKNHTCQFTSLTYVDPHYPDLERKVTIMRGPTSFTRREAIFLHFELEDELRDFFTVSYFVFPGYDNFIKLNLSEQGSQIVDYHRYVPTFALSAGLRMWIKLIMSESHLLDGTKRTDFNVEYSVVKFHDRRPEDEKKRHLFFIFFEWKNDIIEQSYLIYTTTPWSIGAGLCGVFLTLHRGCQLAQTSYKRVQKDKERRSYRKRTLRELRKQKSMQAENPPPAAQV